MCIAMDLDDYGAHLQTTACITAHISDGVGCDGDGVQHHISNSGGRAINLIMIKLFSK